jgi:hypothetical protein
MAFKDKTFSEFLVKKGLALILAGIIIGIFVSVVVIKLIRRKKYFDYVTEKLVMLFDSEKFTVILVSKETKKIAGISDKYINPECYKIKIDPTSTFIQIPYFTRFLSYVLFWGYFSLQALFLKEIFTDTDQSLEDNEFVCYNISIRLVKALYRCERYGLKSIDEIFDSMDQIAGILALYELNQIAFRFSFKFFKWVLVKRFFSRFATRLKDQYENDNIPLISFSQVNYILLMAYLTYSIYDNLVTEKYYIPIKLVCYSILMYANVLSSYETVKYLVSQSALHEKYEPVLVEFENEEKSSEQSVVVNQAEDQGVLLDK